LARAARRDKQERPGSGDNRAPPARLACYLGLEPSCPDQIRSMGPAPPARWRSTSPPLSCSWRRSSSTSRADRPRRGGPRLRDERQARPYDHAGHRGREHVWRAQARREPGPQPL